MTLEVISNKFSNAQIELLNLMAGDLSEDELFKLKQVILEFKASRLSDMMTKHLDDQGIHPDDLLGQHMRTPYYKL